MSDSDPSPLEAVEQPGPQQEALPAATPPDAFYAMRVQVVGLGAAFLILSLSFSVYVYKQNRNLSMMMEARQQQVKQIAEGLKQWTPVMNELAGYSLNKPELAAIFTRHGLTLGTNAPAADRR